MISHSALLSLFGWSSDADDLTRALVFGGLVFTALQFVVTLFKPAPYGRYAKEEIKYLKCKGRAFKKCSRHFLKINAASFRARSEHHLCLGISRESRLRLALLPDGGELVRDELDPEAAPRRLHAALLPKVALAQPALMPASRTEESSLAHLQELRVSVPPPLQQ